MLKLTASNALLAMLHPRAASMASGEQTRTMRGCYRIFSALCVYKSGGAVLKVVPVVPVNFFTCLDWAVFYSHSTDGRAIGAGKEAF
ncbi:hypothetical protein ACYZUD_12135 [Pseudomonas sp. XS1P51]